MRQRVVLDTDIGPDCDDAAALAMMHLYTDRGYVEPLAVCHCTSMPYGVGAIRAINAYYGHAGLPVGTLKDEDLLVGDPRYEKYNRPLSERVPAEDREAPDAVTVYRRVLAAQPDASVVFVAIGPLRNLANLLRSGGDAISPLGGVALVQKKVKRLVMMAGAFSYDGVENPLAGAEWNVEMDVEGARLVAERWPGEIVYCGFEAGYQVVVGGRMAEALPADHPVRQAYADYGCPEGRYSWDLLTVEWAMDPTTAHYALSPWGRIVMDDIGRTTLVPEPGGKHAYLRLACDPKVVAADLDALLITR